VFATPDAHDTGGTLVPRVWLRAQRVLEPGFPPRIRLRRGALVEDLGDRSLDLGRLLGAQIDVHGVQIIRRGPVPPFEGFGFERTFSPLRVMPPETRERENLFQCGT